MTNLKIFFYCILFIFTTEGCKPNINEQIIGKWKDDSNPSHYEILPSGVFIGTVEIDHIQLRDSIHGKWSLNKTEGKDGKILHTILLHYPDNRESVLRISSFTEDEIIFESRGCLPHEWLRVAGK